MTNIQGEKNLILFFIFQFFYKILVKKGSGKRPEEKELPTQGNYFNDETFFCPPNLKLIL